MAGEWRPVPFERLLSEPVRNGVYKPKAFHGRGAKIVNMGELFAYRRLHAIPMKRVELSNSESARFTLSKGDLLFARRSLVAEGAGKCSVVLDVDEPTTFESSIIRARPDSAKADPLFLYYFFNSTGGLHCLDTIRRQVAVAGITGSDLSRLEIPTPPLPEQRVIAHILGTLDDKIELNRRMNETLEVMARALFKSWFVDFDPVRAKAEGPASRSPSPISSPLVSWTPNSVRIQRGGRWDAWAMSST
jgi:type I restriction enzyme S subunit